MGRSTPTKIEPWNGIYLAAADDDNGDDMIKFHCMLLPIKTNWENDFLLHCVQNVTPTGRLHLLKCASFRTENRTK
jgi:hypothetical protein